MLGGTRVQTTRRNVIDDCGTRDQRTSVQTHKHHYLARISMQIIGHSGINLGLNAQSFEVSLATDENVHWRFIFHFPSWFEHSSCINRRGLTAI
jgi:hypothetical protein